MPPKPPKASVVDLEAAAVDDGAAHPDAGAEVVGGVEGAVGHGARRVGAGRVLVRRAVGAAQGRAAARVVAVGRGPGQGRAAARVVAVGRGPAQGLGLAAGGLRARRVGGLREQNVLGGEGVGPGAAVRVVADGVAPGRGGGGRRRRRVAAGEHGVGEAREAGEQAEAEEGRGEGEGAHEGFALCLYML